MPAKKRTAAPRKRHIESPKLVALAFNDAVRDILHADGKFHLGDDRRGDAVWQWDGVRWERIPLVDRRRRDDAPMIEVEHDVEMASVG